ncbi:hypothetical protein [Arthrobacter sp. GAS37]|uniref:hypothetical protein n=1 Tax=Arthrobacter sp. GAS37 TaxID=3156261 RepID=UPI00384C5968
MTTWEEVLRFHSRGEVWQKAAERLENAGFTPDQLAELLPAWPYLDLYRRENWEAAGLDALSVALLASEIEARAVSIRSDAAHLRQMAIKELTHDESVAEVARQLGQTRQAVSRIANDKAPTAREALRNVYGELMARKGRK